MAIPEVGRFIYRSNPLDTVICQIRYNPILKIDTQAPADFQEVISSEYPNFTETSEVIFGIQIGSPQVQAEEFKQLERSQEGKNYEFASEDSKWKVNLTRSSISLSTKDYIKWEDFIERFEKVFNVFVSIYHPTTFTRIGLRYIDIVARSKLGLSGVDWSELIQDYILGVLSNDDVKDTIKNYESHFQVLLEDGENRVRVITKTVQSSEGEQCYLLDSDFFNTNKLKYEEALPVLKYLHSNALKLFRWYIKDKLNDTLGPQQVK